ncbi:MAG: hypothetical protein ACLFOY_05950 [Desulfatibacillaceae bacterium]
MKPTGNATRKAMARIAAAIALVGFCGGFTHVFFPWPFSLITWFTLSFIGIVSVFTEPRKPWKSRGGIEPDPKRADLSRLDNKIKWGGFK